MASSQATEEDEIRSPPGYKSAVWQHFGFRWKDGSTDKTRAICKQCRHEIKYSGNTTNLAGHLKNKHGIDPQANVSIAADVAACSAPLTNFFQQKLNNNSKRAMNITSAISFFICKDMRPYSIVENDGFRELLYTLEPKYTIPSRQHFSQTCIPRLYEQVKGEVQRELINAERVALTTDGWTSCTTQAFLTVTCHHIDAEWQMRSYVLQTRILNDAHTGANLGKVLDDACEEWNIRDKNPALVTDNASNMSVAGVEASLSPHIKCFGHTINLAVQKGLKSVDAARLLGRVRRVVAFFHRSTVATAVLKEKQKLLGLPEHKLKQDVITRWNSSFDMLDRFLEQQAAVCASLLDKKLRKGAHDVQTLNESDISAAEDLVKLLGPVKSATTIMCEEEQPTLSIIAPLKAKLLEHFSISEEDSSLLKELKLTMAGELKQRYLDVKQVLHNASALDARFKKLPFLSEEERDATYQCLIHEAAELWDKKKGNDTVAQVENTPPHSSGDQTADAPSDSPIASQAQATEDYVPVSKKSKALADLFGDTFCKMDSSQAVRTSRERAGVEVAKYKDSSSLILGGNVLEWWKSHQTELPLLANLAKTYLCIPGTSVPSERVFSTAGDIVRSERSVLSPEHVDQLVFLKKNLPKRMSERHD
ncbi:E3 SUMO-protein ligase ZBED1-like [Halichoeres trimaculatus]|uniref:E3 SUMO-protein ligase ZBED1-like n=1 Tax=Halichoeres trimaculatus TaxID=147232 RepID=UPI003D9EDEAE